MPENFSRLELLDTNHIQDDNHNAGALASTRSTNVARMSGCSDSSLGLLPTSNSFRCLQYSKLEPAGALTWRNNASLSIRVLCDVLLPFGDGPPSFQPSCLYFFECEVFGCSALSARVALGLRVSFFGSLPPCLEKAKSALSTAVFGENFTLTSPVKEEERRGAGGEAGCEAGETEGEGGVKGGTRSPVVSLEEGGAGMQKSRCVRIQTCKIAVRLTRKMILDGVCREILLVLYRRYSFEFL
ncbi:hypothetical protein C8R45DRAFT_995420, partial [Mycena sanguinolenta]